MSNTKLRSCPFCGGKVKLMAIAGEPFPPTYEVDISKVTRESDDICYIHCTECKANFHKEIRMESYPLDTITWWNTRKPTDESKIIEQSLRNAANCYKSELERANWELEETIGRIVKQLEEYKENCCANDYPWHYESVLEDAIKIVQKGGAE